MWNNYTLLKSAANIILFITGLIFLYIACYWLTHAPLFVFHKVRIYGDLHRVTPEQVKYIVLQELAGTFFTLDIHVTRTAFNKLPWVREVQIRRHWPDTLDIVLEEHQVLARWGEHGLVNTYGEWFDAASNQQLPIFYGPAGTEKEMMEMYTHLTSELSPARLQLQSLWLSKRRAWKAVLNNQIQLELGQKNIDKRIKRFVTIWARTLEALPYKLESVDMRYPNGLAVRILNDKKHLYPSSFKLQHGWLHGLTTTT